MIRIGSLILSGREYGRFRYRNNTSEGRSAISSGWWWFDSFQNVSSTFFLRQSSNTTTTVVPPLTITFPPLSRSRSLLPSVVCVCVIVVDQQQKYPNHVSRHLEIQYMLSMEGYLFLPSLFSPIVHSTHPGSSYSFHSFFHTHVSHYITSHHITSRPSTNPT